VSWVKTPADFLARISAATCQRPDCSPHLLHLAATIWCRLYARDGVIPAANVVCDVFWSKAGPSPESVAALLVESGLWAEDGSSFRILDIGYQTVPVEVQQARSSAGRSGGVASGIARSNARNARIERSKQTKQTEAKASKRSDERRGEENKTPGGLELTGSGTSVVKSEPQAADEPRQPASKARGEPANASVRPAHPKRREYADQFAAAYRKLTGSGYTWSYRDLAAVDAACARIPIAKWIEACAVYASRWPEWMFRSDTPDLAAFVRNINRFQRPADDCPEETPTPSYLLRPEQRAS
jgi:hypothetical protein